jgi:hypothetical protein
MAKIIIEYCEDGIYSSDQGSWEWLYGLQNDILRNGIKDQHIKVSSELMVELTRLLVVRRIIKADQIIYKYKDKFIKIVKDGGLISWPKGFCDNKELILEELIDFRYQLKGKIDGRISED